MICKNCGSENEEGAATCTKCGGELMEKSGSGAGTPKVETYLGRKIIYLILSLPFLFLIVRPLIELQTFNHGTLLPVKLGVPLLLFLSIGIVLARRSSNKVEAIAAGGDYEKAQKRAKWSKRGYALVFILNLVIGLFLSVSMPAFLSYREKGIDLTARLKLKELVSLQEETREAKGAYASRLEEIEGWTDSDVVEVKLLGTDEKCWKGSAVNIDGRKVIIYDHCSGEGEARYSEERR